MNNEPQNTGVSWWIVVVIVCFFVMMVVGEYTAGYYQGKLDAYREVNLMLDKAFHK